MKTFTLGAPNDFALVSDDADPPHCRVLVADDVETDRLVTIWQFGKAWPGERDILVECAADGAEALEKSRRNRDALVGLDWNMPQQDGANVLRAIREKGLRVPVVVVAVQAPRSHCERPGINGRRLREQRRVGPTQFRQRDCGLDTVTSRAGFGGGRSRHDPSLNSCFVLEPSQCRPRPESCFFSRIRMRWTTPGEIRRVNPILSPPMINSLVNSTTTPKGSAWH